jgi:hypothetical protein
MWTRCPEGCEFVQQAEEPVARPGTTAEGSDEPKTPIRGRGERELYLLTSPDVDDVCSPRICLDLANAEKSRAGIEQFYKKWGAACYRCREDQFYEMRKVIRNCLNRQHLRAAGEGKVGQMSLNDWLKFERFMFDRRRGDGFKPKDPFEFAIREIYAFIERDLFKQVRICFDAYNGCKNYFLAHKKTANRQRLCPKCGGKSSKVRSKSGRQRRKQAGARGRTGIKVSADPRHATVQTRTLRASGQIR